MFKISQVTKITGLTRRQIGYWHNIGFVKASDDPGKSGRARFWNFTDLVALRTVKKLREQNVSIQKIRRVFDYVRKVWPDLESHLSQLTFYVLGQGRDVLVLGPDEKLPVSALRAQGQKVLVFPGYRVEQEVLEAVSKMADEPLTFEEAEESARAWQDYLDGKDSGEPLSKVREELLGNPKKSHG